MRGRKVVALVTVGAVLACYAALGDIAGLFSAQGTEYTGGGPGSPWIRKPIRRQVKSKLSELPEGTIERGYRVQAEILRGIDLRKDPLDLRYKHMADDLSEIKPGYFRPDPFAYPQDLPEDFRPKGEPGPISPDTVLAGAAADLRAGMCAQMAVRGVFYSPSGRLVSVSLRGLEGVPTSSMYLREGSSLPLDVVAAIPPGTLYQEGALIMGVLRVDSIREGYVLFRVGVYFERQPEKVVWEPLTYYRSLGERDYACE
jgi:hypothetical protein